MLHPLHTKVLIRVRLCINIYGTGSLLEGGPIKLIDTCWITPGFVLLKHKEEDFSRFDPVKHIFQHRCVTKGRKVSPDSPCVRAGQVALPECEVRAVGNKTVS